jgi:hypothetical protein
MFTFGAPFDMNRIRLNDKRGRIARTGAALSAGSIFLAVLIWLMRADSVASVAIAPSDWRMPPNHRSLIPSAPDRVGEV